MKIKHLILAAAAAVSSALTSTAQTTNSALTTPVTFADSVIAYGTSYNTNYSFDAVKLDLETGYRQANGVGASSFAKLGYYVTPAIQLNAEIGYFGIGSPINAFEAGVGYAVFQKYDLRVTVEIDGGYDDNQRTGFVEPGLEVKKKLTTNTYASIGIYLPYYVGEQFNTSPTFTTGVGATFQ